MNKTEQSEQIVGEFSLGSRRKLVVKTYQRYKQLYIDIRKWKRALPEAEDQEDRTTKQGLKLKLQDLGTLIPILQQAYRIYWEGDKR